MRIEEVERLLADFYEGKTTEDQEKALKNYFETQNIPAHLQKEKILFLSFHDNELTEVPVGLEEKISKLIDAKEREEMHFFHRHQGKYNWHWVGGIAASILLLFGLGYGINSYYNNDTPKDTFSDPQDVYEVLQSTLIEVSSHLNKGIDQVSKTQKEIKMINQEVTKEID